MQPRDSVRPHQKYKLFPVFVKYRDQVDLVVTVTDLYRDSADNEMVKFAPGTYAGNSYGYESTKYFTAKFYRVDSEGEEMNNDALISTENQRQDILREIQNLTYERRTLHSELEKNRRAITKNQELLRVNKIAQRALKEEM